MQRRSIFVRADWDAEARVWVVTSPDVAGLAIEADTFEEIEAKVVPAIRDLLEANGEGFDGPEIPVHIMAEQLARVQNPCA